MIRENLRLKCLILSHKWLVLLGLLLLVCCKKNEVKTKDIQLIEILTDSLNLKPLPSYLFILSNEGCPSCNKTFYNFMLTVDHSNPKIKFIVSNRGSQVDLSELYEIKNVTFDYKELLIKRQIINPNSAFIKLDSNKIDTILNLQPNNIDQNLNYISVLLKEL